MMSKRNYNVFFHTHTVSGIVISVALYIIFFAGAFALIKDEITVWEKGINYTRNVSGNSIDYDVLVEKIKTEKYDLYGRDIRIVIDEVSPEIFISLSASQDSLAPESSKKYEYFNINKNTYEISGYYAFYSFGELLYRLHFFNQVPIVGVYIAGFVAFFFLFAIVTGVIIHWKKMISNFYVFRPKAKLKTIWTDAHTVLGVIGLPFQFIYALTSCFFCLSFLVLLPANYLYDNDQQQLMEDLRPMTMSYPIETKSNQEFSLNQFRDKTLAKWEHFSMKQVYIRNYGATNMKYQADGIVEDEFIGNGRIIYDVPTGKVEIVKNPYEANYLEGVELTIRRLHFADYGGLALKIIYFMLALITCFVIITGVLIWLEARNKKNVPEAQKRFNQKVGHIYLAICLSMYPIIAFTFIITKLLPRNLDASRQSILYIVFFGLWLVASILLTLRKDNYFTNKISLQAGSIFAFCIPLVNGIISGNWIWNTIILHQYEILFIDIFWICLGLLTTYISLKLEKKQPKIVIKEKIIKTSKINLKNQITMNIKISMLWLFIAVGFIVHHIYGLFGVYYIESVMMEGATGEVPIDHHIYRILFEGIALLFALLTLQVSKKWFMMISFIWAILLGLFNIYHCVTAVIYESSNISEILILIWMLFVSILLVNDLWGCNKKIKTQTR